MFKRRPRLQAFSYVGPHRYFLTFCTADRHRAFTDAQIVDLVRSQILRATETHDFEIPAYCFMPDHLHLLAHGTRETSDMTKFVHAAKQLSGHAYHARTGKRLWQPSYFEHVLREEDDTWGVAAYIVGNPLRAGLVTRVDEYPYLGSCTVSLEELVQFIQFAPRWKYVP
jgi:REP-associated tyrosine transposase